MSSRQIADVPSAPVRLPLMQLCARILPNVPRGSLSNNPIRRAHTSILPLCAQACNRASMLSPEGRCKTLDASADGYVRAEGVGAAVLRALPPSTMAHSGAGAAAGVLALLAGSAVNQDGRSSSLTAPNGPSQQEVLRAALASAGLGPQDMAALSMHGTGGLYLVVLCVVGLLSGPWHVMRGAGREAFSNSSSNYEVGRISSPSHAS